MKTVAVTCGRTRFPNAFGTKKGTELSPRPCSLLSLRPFAMAHGARVPTLT